MHSDAWICDAKFFCELFCYLLQYNYNLNKSELTPFFSHESFAILMSDWMPHVTDNLSLNAAYLPLMLWNFPESIKTDQKLLTASVKEKKPKLPSSPPPTLRPPVGRDKKSPESVSPLRHRSPPARILLLPGILSYVLCLMK